MTNPQVAMIEKHRINRLVVVIAALVSNTLAASFDISTQTISRTNPGIIFPSSVSGTGRPSESGYSFFESMPRSVMTVWRRSRALKGFRRRHSPLGACVATPLGPKLLAPICAGPLGDGQRARRGCPGRLQQPFASLMKLLKDWILGHQGLPGIRWGCK